MRKSRITIVIPLLFSLITAACVPATPVATATPAATQTVAAQNATETPIRTATEASLPATSEPEPVVQPTSRGADLVASDPSLVQLASGQLQLVEFFSFT